MDLVYEASAHPSVPPPHRSLTSTTGRLRLVLSGVLVAGSTSCLSFEEFTCTEDLQCVSGGVTGSCQPSGQCAFPDDTCPSGQRFGDEAAQCVTLDADTGVITDTGMPDQPVFIDAEADSGVPEDAADAGFEDTGAEDQGVDAGPPPACDITQIAAGDNSACVIRDDGRAYCWGASGNGETGLGVAGGTFNIPRVVLDNDSFEPLEDVISVDVGRAHSCALQDGGQVLCFGGAWWDHLGVPEDDVTYPGAWKVRRAPGDFLDDAEALAVGRDATCARRANGQLECWGYNARGQLGRSSTITSSPVPAAVVDINDTPLDPVGAFGMGIRHGCAVLGDEALCWGANNCGELGDGTLIERNYAAPVSPLPSLVDEFAVGWDHTCALLADRHVWCWGDNGLGQLGNGSLVLEQSTTPIEVVDSTGTALDDVSHIVAGEEHTCALKSNGEVVCWGANSDGQLGDGNLSARPSAAAVVLADTSRLSGVVELASGYFFTCARRDVEPKVMCWGANDREQLGRYRSDLVRSSVPIALDVCQPSCIEPDLIEAGRGFTCSLVAGRVYCSGKADSDRMTNDVSYGETTEALDIRQLDGSPLEGISALSLGNGNACALASDTTLLCWGRDENGRLGSASDGSSPAAVVDANGLPLTGVVDFDAWWEHTCAVLSDGTAWCWGENDNGQLGTGNFVDTSHAVQVLISDAARISVGETHTCALKDDGSVWCWGDNDELQLGTVTGTVGNPNPLQVFDAAGQALLDVTDVELGHDYSCALKGTETVWCWGRNSDGELGRPAQGPQVEPGIVVNAAGVPLTAVVQITAGDHTSCARSTAGSLQCWGYGRHGRKGDGLETSTMFATTVLGNSVYTHVTAGLEFTCALTTTGDAECWGRNHQSQLGRSYKSLEQSAVPVTPEYQCP